MVRLRSNRWYSLDGQGKSRASVATQSAGSRKVISLCFLLALVVVLMQKASDPKHVRNAFSALGVPFDRQGATSEPSQVDSKLQPASTETADVQEVDAKWLNTCRDLVPRLFDGATNEQLLEFSRRWFAKLDVDAPGEDEEDPGDAVEALAQLGQDFENRLTSVEGQLEKVPETDRLVWEQQLIRFRTDWNELWDSVQQGRVVALVSPTLTAVLTEFLDDKLTYLMRDAAPWTNSETVPFLRLIQRGQQGVSVGVSDPPLLNTLQLEAELSVYRGKQVRFRGEVRRVEFVERAANAFGIKGYWSLWLRGDDGAFQPVSVYTTNSLATHLERAVAERRFPAIEVLGIVGKRLAYASQESVEVAPTIFALSILQFAEDVLPSSVETADRDLAAEFGWTALVGLLIAGLVLTPVLANWRRRTVRAIRKSSSGLLLIAVLFPLSAMAQEAGDAKPPWAQLEDDPVRSMLVERLTAAFTEDGIHSLEIFLDGDSQNCPNSVLKTMHALRQLGWSRALANKLPVELSSQRIVVKNAELQGYVRLAMPVKLDEDQQLWFQRDANDQLYRIEVELSEGGQAGAERAEPQLQTVFCSSVPSQWMESAQLKQPVVVRALQLLQLNDDDTEPLQSVCFFSQGPQWRSLSSEKSSLGLQPSLPTHLRYLGLLGWDLANLDIVSRHNQQAIQAEEAGAFYSLMRVMDGANRPEGERTSVQQALSNPTDYIGAPIDWRVRVVNGSVVEVASDENQQALGADRYFQFDGFVDMGNQIVHYRLSGEKQTSTDGILDFENEFPITVVMRAPSDYVPQLEVQSGEKNWSVGKYVRVSGVFYRLWSFRSQMMEDKSATARQAAPLIVAATMLPDAPPIRAPESPIGWFGYALCIATLFILGGILYTVFQRDTRIRRNPRVS